MCGDRKYLIFSWLFLFPGSQAQDLFLDAYKPPFELQAQADKPPNVAKWYQLDEGVCINGDKAALYAYHEPADKGTNMDWVIQFGGPPGLNWCIDEAHCEIFGKPSATPPPPGTNMTFPGFGGPFSTNCTDNPDFCQFNMAQLNPSCTMDMFMGDNDYKTKDGNYTLHFDGLKVLESSIKKLGELGLSKAKQVLLTGVSHAGTMVYLHADRVHNQIKAMNPGLQKFKALPVDGLHPKMDTVIYAGNDLSGPKPDSWLTAALQAIGTMAKVDGAVLDGCKRANPTEAWKCLYVNETLPYIQSSLFAVNQMLSVWDSQCQLEGLPMPNFILQIGCSLKGPGWATARGCNQYPEYCDPVYIEKITAPYQKQYVVDYEKSGFHAKAGNGGFFHSCYLGAYFHSGWAGSAIWNIIDIGGVTMRQAISNWWNDSGAKWTTDCTWDPTPQEPPKWTNKTCNDWTNGDHHGKPGCYVNSCCPPDDGVCKYFSCTPRPPWGNKWNCNPSCGKIQVYY